MNIRPRTYQDLDKNIHNCHYINHHPPCYYIQHPHPQHHGGSANVHRYDHPHPDPHYHMQHHPHDHEGCAHVLHDAEEPGHFSQ